MENRKQHKLYTLKSQCW